MLPSANPGQEPRGQQDPPSSQGGGLINASPDQLAAQAQMQQPPAPPREMSLGSRSLVEDVKKELMRRYRNPSFVVPMSIKEPPIATQLPGLIEGGATTPTAFPAATNPMAAMGMMGGMGGPSPMDPLQALLGGSRAAVGADMGVGQGGMGQPDPSRILNSQGLGFNPEDVLLM